MTKMAKMRVAVYLIKRLKQLGVKHLFGLPGDFNLEFLSLVEDEEGIEWIGGCNELNSGYVADGYARVNKISVSIDSYFATPIMFDSSNDSFSHILGDSYDLWCGRTFSN